ncbi:unnamed protein product [Paramecium pentaurelia]|uniref:Phosphoribulokinase/uridine kinase domain-containing protein n=1 Tax=Paramecium pentaurelia TaxID=43138 RepID=A0A8S1UQH5_9CILI|nr:unnamed protein product [Paramecium pentaurelia]
MEQLQVLIQEKYKGSPLLIGLQGMQGVGKTTLGIQMKKLLSQLNIQFDSISIDDFYLSYIDRENLDKRKYKYRGPPGTHDYQMIIKTLSQFKEGKSIEVPIFDKSLHNGQGDRVGQKTIKCQVLLFEGWFVGYKSKCLYEFKQKEKLLQLDGKDYDQDLEVYINEQLKLYEPIWEQFDILIQLKPNPFELSLKWRLEAEKEMRIKTGNGMSDEQIVDFVTYFWNCLHPLIYNDLICDLVIEVNKQRQYKVL